MESESQFSLLLAHFFLSAHVWFCKIEHINCIICLYQYSRETLLLWQLDVIVAQFHEMTTDLKKQTIYEQTTKQNIQGTRMHSNKWDTAYSDL